MSEGDSRRPPEESGEEEAGTDHRATHSPAEPANRRTEAPEPEPDEHRSSEKPVAEDHLEDVSASDQAIIEDLLGPESKKGALRRGVKILPRILPYLKPYKKLAIISVILTVFMALLALAEPWPTAFVVDSIIGDKPAPGWMTAIFGDSVGGLIALAVVATLLLTLLAGLMLVWNEYLSTTVDQRMVLDFRSDMFKHAQRLSLAFHDKESKGILMYRINDQAAAMGQIVIAIPALAQSVLTLIGMAYISIKINPLLALLALGTTPFVAYSTTFYTDRIEPRLYRVRGLGALNLAIVYEAMSMMRVVLAFGTQGREYTKFRKQGENLVDEVVGLTVRQTIFKLAVQMITAAGTAAVIGVGAYQAVNGEISAGELLVILSYISQIYMPLEELTNTITNFQQLFINLLMSFDLMDMEPEVTEKKDAVPLKKGLADVELEGVGFSYPTRPDVLKDVSLTIAAGTAVAIVGPTGAGKSTMVSLLPRFYDPSEGSIRIDGHDLRDAKLDDVRGQFSMVLQEPVLFSGTIASNIRYGKPDASEEEVIAAAKAANAHDFIAATPDGYETMLGERGAQLSGGERQRISVARAFLTDAPILILDEPTSSIDSATEAVILDALDRLMEGRTTIVIAHRLSTLRSVDEIVVLKDGAIEQRGAHDELAGTDGLYRDLWEAQTLGAGAPEGKGSDPEVLATEAADSVAETELEPDQETAAGGVDPGADPPFGVSEPLTAAGLETYGPGLSHSGPTPFPVPEAPVDGLKAPAPLEPAQTMPTPAAALPRPKIVLLGMLTKIPVGGVAWLVGHYAAGFERLGYEVYYVEAHARTPSMFMTHPEDDGAGKAAAFIEQTVSRFGLENRWAFQALHENGQCYGMSAAELERLYREAALIINMHGGTLPLPEHAATDRLVYLGTDPVEVELEVDRADGRALEFLDQHAAYFTWGLNYGNPDCGLPWARPYGFIPSPPPVLLDCWENDIVPAGPFTTIGNWRQRYRNVRYGDRVYKWSKHQQFMRIIDLPRRTDARLELALSSYEGRDQLLLAEHGWRVRSGLELSRDMDSYHDYIVGSAGEVSAAKEQNVHFRTGWFSERSVMYLAAGRPVIVQDTGFGGALPLGEGLFAFSDLDSAQAAVEAVEAEPARHRRAAREIAREFLSHDVVLGNMLDHVGLRRSRTAKRPSASSPAPVRFPAGLALKAAADRAVALDGDTRDYIRERPIPTVIAAATRPTASIVVPVGWDLAVTRLTLESVLANTVEPSYELIAVDHGAAPQTSQYLDVLASRNRNVRVVRVDQTAGYAAACDRGLAASRGAIVLLLGDDVVVPPAWLPELVTHLGDPDVGLVTPTTNAGGGHTQVPAGYQTYEEMCAFARERQEAHEGEEPSDVEPDELYCVGARRDVWERLGPLAGQSSEIVDALSSRIRGVHRRWVCAEDGFVHRFGASVHVAAAPELAPSHPPAVAAVEHHVPKGTKVLMITTSDSTALELDGYVLTPLPLPIDPGGDDSEPSGAAIGAVEHHRENGCGFLVVPASAQPALAAHPVLREYLESYTRAAHGPDAIVYDLSTAPGAAGDDERTA